MYVKVRSKCFPFACTLIVLESVFLVENMKGTDTDNIFLVGVIF